MEKPKLRSDLGIKLAVDLNKLFVLGLYQVEPVMNTLLKVVLAFDSDLIIVALNALGAPIKPMAFSACASEGNIQMK